MYQSLHPKSLRIAATLLLALTVAQPWLLRSAGADALNGVIGCDLEGISQTGSAESHALDGTQIKLANWNIQKASQQGWRHDLQLLGEDIDLLLLQEAVLERELAKAIDDRDLHSVFAPGYQTGAEQSGVMTLSRTPPVSKCLLTHQEPWLLTPKATGVSTYRLKGSQQRLLVINVHAVNFSFGLEALDQQLRDASQLIRQHQGPVIFSGDFNTWSEQRLQLVTNTITQLRLSALDYDNDKRKLVFGRPLDHVFVRGLKVISSGTRAVSSSDHNPIFATLSLDP